MVTFWHVMILQSFPQALVLERGLESGPKRTFAAVNPMAVCTGMANRTPCQALQLYYHVDNDRK